VTPRGGRLSVVVFAAGAASLATEIAAARLLAPSFGNSTVVWANLIGLVLASLAVGYTVGGRLADRRPDPRLLGRLVLLSALLLALVPFAARPFLDLAVRGLDRYSVGAVVGSFFAVLVLFAPPVILLGMVSPFAVRLSVRDVSTAGEVAGRLYALSTAGGLAGTFGAALVAIPAVGTQRTLLGVSVVLATGGAILLGRRWAAAAVALGALLAVPPGAVRAGSGLLWEDESLYQYVSVVQHGDERVLELNEGVVDHSVWRPDTVLTGGEWDMFLVVPALLGRPVQRVATLGNAGGTTARALGVFSPQARIDGVELDPAVTRAARRFLGLGDNPRLHVVTADARPFLRRTHTRYDLVLVDAYRPPYVPFYLATEEFFRLVRDRLAPDGIVALNVATVPGDDRLARGIEATLRSAFPQVLGWQALRFNRLVLGLRRPVAPGELRRRLTRMPAPLRPLGRLAARGVREGAHGRPWTDDRSPVEWVTDRMLVHFAARGGRLDEQLLPRAP
jgi:predicted membrane-bound spermidine synthase